MADITFECPECKQHLVVDAGYAGQQVQCPTCSATNVIPNCCLSSDANENEVLVYAAPGGRFLAFVIDWLIISICFSVVIAIAHEGKLGQFNVFDWLLWIFAAWAYFALLHASIWQATLGMRFLKIKIINGKGQRISTGMATARYFAWLLCFYLSFILIGLIGFFRIPFTKKKQGWHDMICGTSVVKDKRQTEWINSCKALLKFKSVDTIRLLIICVTILIGIWIWRGSRHSSTTSVFDRLHAASSSNNASQEQREAAASLNPEQIRAAFEEKFNETTTIKDEYGFPKSIFVPQWWFDVIHPVGTGKSITVTDAVLNTDSNGALESIGLEMILNWEGPIQNGSTTFRVLYDPSDNSFKQLSVLKSDGITRQDVDDFAAGYQLGAQLRETFSSQ